MFSICSDTATKLPPMIPISITAEALVAIANSFPMGGAPKAA